MHQKIITLTLNPVIHKSTTVAGISPNTKLSCTAPTFDAGGGGINVSRAIKKLEGEWLCVYLAGGPTGEHLHELLDINGIHQSTIKIEGRTRDNLAVTDTLTNLQYRFGVAWTHCKKRRSEYGSKTIRELFTK
jgi:6-phosphofructokinase 2